MQKNGKIKNLAVLELIFMSEFGGTDGNSNWRPPA